MLKNAIHEFLKTGQRVEVDLNESAAIVGSGDGKGGRTEFTTAQTALRQMNPVRMYARMVNCMGKSDVQFVQRVGNAASATPWGYPVQGDQGTPNYDTAFWQLPVRAIPFTLPIRDAVLADIEGMAEIVEKDIMAELGTLEGLSLMRNNDQTTTQNATGVPAPVASGSGFTLTFGVANTSGFVVGQYVTIAGNFNNDINGFWQITAVVANASVTVFYPANPGPGGGGTTTLTVQGAFGGPQGLRGLATYPSGTAAYGTSGRNTNNGIHTIANVNYSIAATDDVKYTAITNVIDALPAQYWHNDSLCWQIHPSLIKALRALKDSSGQRLFLDVGDFDAGPAGGFGGAMKPLGKLMGFPVYANSNLQVANPGTLTAGDVPAYLGAWEPAVSITNEHVVLEKYEQTQPGFITIYGELRACASVTDPNAIVRLTVTA